MRLRVLSWTLAVLVGGFGVVLESSSAAVSEDPPMTLAAAPDLVAADAVWSADLGLVLASVPAGGSDGQGTIVAFDPASGAVDWSLEVGGEPRSIALSDDGTKLHVGLYATEQLIRIDIDRREVVATWALPRSEDVASGVHAVDIVAVPSEADAVVVALRLKQGSPSEAGIAVLWDSTLQLQDVWPIEGARQLAFVDDARFVGVEDGGFVSTFELQDGMVSLIGARIFDGRGNPGLSVDSGHAYVSDGTVLNATSGDQTATIPTNGSPAPPSIHANSVLLMDLLGWTSRIQQYDRASLEPIGPPLVIEYRVARQQRFLATPAGILAWDEFGFLGPPTTATVRGDIDVDLGNSGFVYRGPRLDVCIEFWDLERSVLLAAGESVGGTYRIEVPSGRATRILAWDCLGVGLFAEWAFDTLLFDVDQSHPFLLRGGASPEVSFDLEPVFIDLAPGAYYVGPVVFLHNSGLTTGCRDIHYCPDDSVTREQMASFVARFWRRFGGTCPETAPPVSDIGPGSFAYLDVGCLFELGITRGTGPMAYSPGEFVTREQMAAFMARLYRAFGGTCPEGGHEFTDVRQGSFAEDDIACIFQLGLTTGTSPSSYDPSGAVTRGQMAAFLQRLFDVIAGSG